MEKTDIKVPLISKIAYGMGDVGCNFSWMFVGNFLMIFYTDVFGISMAAVGVLMLVSRVWDAVNDPLIGYFSDRTQTRWGRYRPWLLIAAPFTAILLVFTFWAHPMWSDAGKIVYMYITYGLLVLGYTAVNIPYGTLCGAMTQNMTERAKINTARSVSAMIAIGVINVITVPLMKTLGKGSPAKGYLSIALLYGLIFVACLMFCFYKTQEVVTVPVKSKMPIKNQLKLITQNRPYLFAWIGQLLFGFTLYGRNAGTLYYFKYVEGNEALFSTYALVIVLPAILGAASFPYVFNKLQNKGRAASVLSVGTGLMLIMLYQFSPIASPVLFYSFSGLAQFFFSGFNTAIYAIIPDCVEYGEWKTGIRNDGFQYAFISLGNKIGMALGTALLAWGLSQLGYVANQTQNPQVIHFMKLVFTIIPGIMWLITGMILYFYKLNKSAYGKIIKEIEERKLA